MTEEQFSRMSYKDCLELVRLHIERCREASILIRSVKEHGHNDRATEVACDLWLNSFAAKRIDELLSRP